MAVGEGSTEEEEGTSAFQDRRARDGAAGGVRRPVWEKSRQGRYFPPLLGAPAAAPCASVPLRAAPSVFSAPELVGEEIPWREAERSAALRCGSLAYFSCVGEEC